MFNISEVDRNVEYNVVNILKKSIANKKDIAYILRINTIWIFGLYVEVLKNLV